MLGASEKEVRTNVQGLQAEVRKKERVVRAMYRQGAKQLRIEKVDRRVERQEEKRRKHAT